jgi:hypothetical protein
MWADGREGGADLYGGADGGIGVDELPALVNIVHSLLCGRAPQCTALHCTALHCTALKWLCWYDTLFRHSNSSVGKRGTPHPLCQDSE